MCRVRASHRLDDTVAVTLRDIDQETGVLLGLALHFRIAHAPLDQELGAAARRQLDVLGKDEPWFGVVLALYDYIDRSPRVLRAFRLLGADVKLAVRPVLGIDVVASLPSFVACTGQLSGGLVFERVALLDEPLAHRHDLRLGHVPLQSIESSVSRHSMVVRDGATQVATAERQWGCLDRSTDVGGGASPLQGVAWRGRTGRGVVWCKQPRRQVDEVYDMRDDPRRVVLAELRDMSRRQNATSVVLSLEIKTLSEHSGVPEGQLTDALSDLLTEGLAEPYAATMGQSAVQGACRITGEGLRELGGMEAPR